MLSKACPAALTCSLSSRAMLSQRGSAFSFLFFGFRLSSRVLPSDRVICFSPTPSLGAGYREAMIQLQHERADAVAAAKQPPKIVWDIPGPPYELPDPLEAALA